VDSGGQSVAFLPSTKVTMDLGVRKFAQTAVRCTTSMTYTQAHLQVMTLELSKGHRWRERAKDVFRVGLSSLLVVSSLLSKCFSLKNYSTAESGPSSVGVHVNSSVTRGPFVFKFSVLSSLVFITE
jgi:hypothetical protein